MCLWLFWGVLQSWHLNIFAFASVKKKKKKPWARIEPATSSSAAANLPWRVCCKYLVKCLLFTEVSCHSKKVSASKRLNNKETRWIKYKPYWVLKALLGGNLYFLCPTSPEILHSLYGMQLYNSFQTQSTSVCSCMWQDYFQHLPIT